MSLGNLFGVPLHLLPSAVILLLLGLLTSVLFFWISLPAVEKVRVCVSGPAPSGPTYCAKMGNNHGYVISSQQS